MNKFIYTLKKGVIKSILSTSLSVIILSSVITSSAHANGRFNAPEFNSAVSDFNERGDSSDLNVDYLIALTFNKGRKIVRDAAEIGRNATAAFTNTANQNSNPSITDNNGAISNSVVIPIGTQADTIIVINQNEGDSIAIER